MGVCCPVLQIQTLFQTQKCHFPHSFSDLASNIIGSYSDLRLLRLEHQQKDVLKSISNSHIIFLSYLFGIETTETFTRSHSSLENHTRFQTKMCKVYSRFQTETAHKPYPLGGGGGCGNMPFWLMLVGEYPPPGTTTSTEDTLVSGHHPPGSRKKSP